MRPVGRLHSYRMDPIRLRDGDTRAAIESCDELTDKRRLLDAWGELLQVDDYDGEPVWSHCDLTPGNLLVSSGALSAVIDWGGLALGDPALDCMIAWTLLAPADRAVFRAEVAVDDSTWARARVWAFSIAVVALAYYYQSDNAQIADYSRHAIHQVTAG